MKLSPPVTYSRHNLVHPVQLPSHSSNLLIPKTNTISSVCASLNPIEPRSLVIAHFKSKQLISDNLSEDLNNEDATSFPSMSDIIETSKAQNLDLQLQTLGPFFRVTAKSMETGRELGRAEGLLRVWFEGKILHLDCIKLSKETLGIKKSIFGIGLFIGAVAIRYGYDCGCRKAELLAINDTDLYHTKLMKYYARVGFKAVYEVNGSSLGDMGHMLVWGGIGTRMDATIEDLLTKWSAKFRPSPKLQN
ncbi:hypothetical protein LIER_34386 [Lithospermum erythrorhizon]|uniref:Uncharacterized protein n=1 Tax=Lithospermum erythrorhizon TaxID=34254 RepID=A0AAV3RZI5_LITER